MLCLILPASARTLDLRPGQPIGNVLEQLVPIPGAAIDLSTPEGRADAAARLDGAPASSPPRFVPAGMWMAVRLVNRGETSGEWVLDTEMPSWIAAEVFLVNTAGARVVLRDRAGGVGLSERTVHSRILASPPFSLRAGETIEIWIRFDAGAITKNAVRLATPASLLSSRTAHAHAYGFYAGAGLLVITFLAVFSFVLRFRPALYFALFFLALVMTNLVIEGYVFALIHPESPGLLTATGMIGRALTALLYLQFIRSFLSSRARYPTYDTVLRWFMAAIVAGLVWVVLDPSIAALAATALAMLVFIGLVARGLYVGVRDSVPGARFFAAGSLVFLCASLFVLIGGLLPVPLGIRQSNDITTMLNLIDGIIFAMAVVAQAFGLRRERDAALAAELVTARERLTLSQALLAAERDRDQARRLAEGRRERLAATSHDLRQPLTSLKLALEEAEATSPAVREKLRGGLDYLDTILSETLADSRPGDGEEAGKPDEPEAVPVQVVFDNLARMFVDEARAKGLRLDFVPTGAVVAANPVALIRCLSNLVANAIRYTGSGRVLVGARRVAGAIAVEVRDTGPGLDAEALERVQRPYERAAGDSDGRGEGLGLAIVGDLSARQGWRLVARSRPGRGSVFAIGGLPRAAGDGK